MPLDITKFYPYFGEKNVLLLASKIQEVKYLHKYYSPHNPIIEDVKHKCVYMADGRFIHGGLCDRIIGMVSAYTFCKERNLPFGIYFVEPFDISVYLEPNLYNWRVDADEISYNSKQSKPIIIKPTQIPDSSYFVKRLQHFIEKYEQLHLYNNTMYNVDFFCQSFHELFKPSQNLQQSINTNIEALNCRYISITFRFQQLLGDFKEGNYPVLNNEDRYALIEKCLNVIDRMKSKHPDIEKVLITSDSIYFLEVAQKKFDYVYVIPGQLNHIDYCKNKAVDSYIKSFTDLFMISKAQTAYAYATGLMYAKSGFAKTAALIGNINFININET